jgi:predicted nucleotidyltransferase
MASRTISFSHPPPEVVENLLQDLLAALHETQGENLVSVVLYGSVARGEAHARSDIDLLIICHDLPRGAFDRWRVFRQATDRLKAQQEALLQQGYTVRWSPVLKTVEEAKYHSPLYLDMTLDARLLYDRDGFFNGVLDEMRARMRELGSRRVTLPSGTQYWDLKPDYQWPEIVEL